MHQLAIKRIADDNFVLTTIITTQWTGASCVQWTRVLWTELLSALIEYWVEQCVQHSCYSQKLSTTFLLIYGPVKVQSLTPTTRFRESQQHEHELKVTRLNILNQRLVEVWQCSNTAFEWKDAILCFCISPGSAESPIRRFLKIKRLLIAYFLKKISKSIQIHVCQSHSKTK